MTTFSPTHQQQAAIAYQSSMVITACPGSGKTTVMKEKIRKVTPAMPSHKGVIAITFTKKASQELKKKCTENAHDTKQSFFGTTDSFCLKEVILPFLSRVWGGNPSNCKVIKRLDDHFKSLLGKEYGSPTCDDVINDDGFRCIYENGFLWMSSFAALALHVINISASARRYIKARYTHVFIDEYQDSSLAQHQLFLKLLEIGLTATAVGDTWQSIYEFRGGNPKLLESLVNDSENFKHFEITVNYRSHVSIINYASRLLDDQWPIIQCEQKRVFRRLLTGKLTDAGQLISDWISDWVAKNEWGVAKASDIAILAKSDRSLKLIANGLKVNYRVYSDNPLDEIGSDCSDLYVDLLAYRYGSTPTAQDLLDKQFELIAPRERNLATIRKAIRSLRGEDQVDSLIAKFRHLALVLGMDETRASDDALRKILQKQELIKQFMPLDDDEIQVMTLHKSKGLEFKVVFHLDLEEWSFPFQQVVNNDWDNPIYPSLSQDTNLHYVGITRAQNCCILIRVELRQNSQGNFSQSKPSYFLRLPQLEGLYA